MLQVGDARTPGFYTALTYRAEIVPLDNPYATKVGEVVRARVLVDGRRVANQLVISGDARLKRLKQSAKD